MNIIDYNLNIDSEKYGIEALLEEVSEADHLDLLKWDLYMNKSLTKLLEKKNKDQKTLDKIQRLLTKKSKYLQAKQNLTWSREDCDDNLVTYKTMSRKRAQKLTHTAMKIGVVFNPTNPLFQFEDDFKNNDNIVYEPIILEMFLNTHSFKYSENINGHKLSVELLSNKNKKLGKYDVLKFRHRGADPESEEYWDTNPNIRIRYGRKIVHMDINYQTKWQEIVNFIVQK